MNKGHRSDNGVRKWQFGSPRRNNQIKQEWKWTMDAKAKNNFDD